MPATNPALRRKASEDLTRTERKDLTRNGLLRAALALIGSGRSFTSLGIREIAREAGVVPNAFYRHFRNTDELGLALVEEVGITLRRLLREARQPHVRQSDVVRQSVQVYHHYVLSNRLHFLFICSERAGGSRALRMAIRHHVTHFVSEMAQDIRQLGLSLKWPPTACSWCAVSSSPACWRRSPRSWTCHPTTPCWRQK